jgi:hypothetical protein
MSDAGEFLVEKAKERRSHFLKRRRWLLLACSLFPAAVTAAVAFIYRNPLAPWVTRRESLLSGSESALWEPPGGSPFCWASTAGGTCAKEPRRRSGPQPLFARCASGAGRCSTTYNWTAATSTTQSSGHVAPSPLRPSGPTTSFMSTSRVSGRPGSTASCTNTTVSFRTQRTTPGTYDRFFVPEGSALPFCPFLFFGAVGWRLWRVVPAGSDTPWSAWAVRRITGSIRLPHSRSLQKRSRWPAMPSEPVRKAGLSGRNVSATRRSRTACRPTMDRPNPR